MLARKSFLLAANSVVGAILGFLALKAIALYMGAAEYGQLTYAISLVGTISFVTNLGFHKAHQKRISEGRDPGDCIATYAVVIIGLAAFFIALVLGGLVVYRFGFGRQLTSTTNMALILVTLSNAATVIRQIGKQTFLGERQVARREASILTEHLVRVPAQIFVALLYASAKNRGGPIFEWLRQNAPGLGEFVAAHGADALAFAVFLSSFISMLVALGLLVQHFPWGSFDLDLAKSYTSFAAPEALTAIAQSVTDYVDKSMLGYFWGSADVGRYSGVERLLLAMRVIDSAFNSLLFPAISEKHGEGDHEGIQYLVEGSLRYISMVMVPITFGTAALAEPFIRILLSNEWLAADYTLAVLSVLALVQALSTPLSAQLYGTGRPDAVMKSSLGGTTLRVLLLFVFIPSSLFGFPMLGLKGLGAAIASLVAAIAGIAILAFFCRHLPRRSALVGPTLHHIAGGVMAVSVWATHAYVFELVRWFHAPLFVLYGAVIYVGLLWLLGELERDDMEFFWNVIHPGEMASYIREELSGPDDD